MKYLLSLKIHQFIFPVYHIPIKPAHNFRNDFLDFRCSRIVQIFVNELERMQKKPVQEKKNSG